MLGTQRYIGSHDFTNLIRRGSSISSSVSDIFISSGESSATSARFKSTRDSDYYDAELLFNLTHTKVKFDPDDSRRVVTSDGFTNIYEFGSSDFDAIEAGSLMEDGTRQDNGDEVRLDYIINVIGNAGSILDTSRLGIEMSAAGGFRTTHYLGDTKNLITFQSDVNYDGRVSMIDLAYVNAGSRLKSVNSSSPVSDVDINFDGEISIDDLEVLDGEWGQSIHDSSTSNSFLGSSSVSLEDLASQIVGDSILNWSNDSFQQQNLSESADDFIGSINESGAANVVIGTSVLNSHLAFEGRFEDLQDPLS